jgi:hypothetical protein
MCSPCAAPHITAGIPTRFERMPRSTGVARISFGAEPSLIFNLTFRNPTGRVANGGSGEF